MSYYFKCKYCKKKKGQHFNPYGKPPKYVACCWRFALSEEVEIFVWLFKYYVLMIKCYIKRLNKNK